jgi:ATP-dependent Clp protease ATP-binding subunit ClpX
MPRFNDGKELKDADGKDLVRCAFCDTSWRDAKHLMAGPGVYICDVCVERFHDDIIEMNTE